MGVHRRRLSDCTRRDRAATPSDDLVERRFNPDAPDRLYVADVTQHRTSEGWLHLAVVIGWAVAWRVVRASDNAIRGSRRSPCWWIRFLPVRRGTGRAAPQIDWATSNAASTE